MLPTDLVELSFSSISSTEGPRPPRNPWGIRTLLFSTCLFFAGCGAGSETTQADGSLELEIATDGTEVPLLEEPTMQEEGIPVTEEPPGPLKLTRLTPKRGPENGGTIVRIEGQGFWGEPLEILFGFMAATDLQVLSDQVLLVTSPGGVPSSTVDVVVKSQTRQASLMEIFTYMGIYEQEPKNASGENDVFEGAQEIPLNADFWAYIGELNDIDTFFFSVPQPGVVSIQMDFKNSFDVGGIYDVALLVYANEDLPWTFYGAEYIHALTTKTPYNQGFERSVEPLTRYYIKITSTPGSSLIGKYGYDPYNPYRLRAQYFPGPNLEADQPNPNPIPIGSADTWTAAVPLAFDSPEGGSIQLQSYAWHHLDFDWYTFTTSQNGWLRIIVDISEFDPNPTETAGNLFVSLLTKDPDWDKVMSVTLGDPPMNPRDVYEIGAVPSDRQFYLRLWSFTNPWMQIPYTLSIEHFPGSFEDNEPGSAPPGDTKDHAFDLGELVDGELYSHESYIWHHQDRDWIKLKIPPGDSGLLCLVWNYTDSYDALGWYNQNTNASGIDYDLLLYPESWQTYAGHLALEGTDDVPQKSIHWPVDGDAIHYVLLRANRGFDLENPYEFKVGFYAGALNCP